MVEDDQSEISEGIFSESTSLKNYPGLTAAHKKNALLKAQGFPIGRPKGVPNKLTQLVRSGLATVYDDLGGDDAFLKWARAHKTQFYTGLMRCIPKEKEVNSLGTGVTIVVGARDDDPPSQ